MGGLKTPMLTIVGCGPGAPELITQAGYQAIASAELAVGSQFLLERFALPHQRRVVLKGNLNEVLEQLYIEAKSFRTVLLVGGDPGLCSFARLALEKFGRENCRVIPGISSVQLAFARLGLDWSDAKIVAAHKELPQHAVEELRNASKIVVLAGHHAAKQWIENTVEQLGGERRIVVCQDLTLPTECIEVLTLDEFRSYSLRSRSIVLLLNPEDMPQTFCIPD